MADATEREKRVLGDAVQGFHTITRLAAMAIQETSKCTEGDGGPLLLAIRDLAEKHGLLLDDCLGTLTGDRVGVFDPIPEEAESAGEEDTRG